MFKQGELYIVQTTKQNFIGVFAGINEVAKPFLQFLNVTMVDDGKHTHFLKTGKLVNSDFKNAYAFKGGFWIRDNWIVSAIHVPTAAPKQDEETPPNERA